MMSNAPVKLEWVEVADEVWTADVPDGRSYRVFQQRVRNLWVCTVKQGVCLNFVGVGDTPDEAKALAEEQAAGGAQ